MSIENIDSLSELSLGSRTHDPGHTDAAINVSETTPLLNFRRWRSALSANQKRFVSALVLAILIAIFIIILRSIMVWGNQDVPTPVQPITTSTTTEEPVPTISEFQD